MDIYQNNESSKFAEIIVDIKAYDVDHTFHYSIPPSFSKQCKIGARVLIPFANRQLEGYIVNISNHADVENPKSVLEVFDEQPPLTAELVELSDWLANRYCTTRIACIQAMLPSGLKAKSTAVLKVLKHFDTQRNTFDARILAFILSRKRTTKEQVLNQFPNSGAFVEQLIQEGILAVEKEYNSGIQTKTIQAARLTDQARMNFGKLFQTLPTRAQKQKAILRALYGSSEMIPVRDLLTNLQTSRSTVERLAEQGFVHIEAMVVRRDPYSRDYEQELPLPLTPEQEETLVPIVKAMEQKESCQFLLHGITGSGKTEVYLQAMQACLQQNKQAIMLVPEISLTPQTVERFKKRFGDAVAVLHSRLSAGERYDEWLRIREQKVKIVVGARSAIFAPFQTLGLIIMDEEHESSYKQEDHPKYVTHEVAAWRANHHQAVLVFGSATPSFERMAAAVNRDIHYLKLTKRVFGQALPAIEIVDMRNELMEGNRTMFSRSLRTAITTTLENKKQILLFLNRRGHSTFVLCRACGEALKCPHCDISLTLHKKYEWQQLRCHYCGYARAVDVKCPACGSQHIRHFGTGTQKVEEALKTEFPDLKIIRMDIDTTSKKGAHERLLDRFRKREADVLLGTQMIAKGLDFPDVALVGVIAADTSLHMPDYRANERTFQLLSQVAGRAGRHKDQGSVVIQTYAPTHKVILSAAKQDYHAFFEQEMQIREHMHYPPFVEFASFLLAHQSESTAAKMAGSLAELLHHTLTGMQVQILPAAPAPFPKINGKYRYHVLMKYTDWWMIAEKVRKIYIEMFRKVKKADGTLSIDIHAQTIL